MVDEHLDDLADEAAAEGQAPLGRRLTAEFVGTLVFVAVATGVVAVLVRGQIQRLGDILDFLASQQVPDPASQSDLYGALVANSLGDAMPVAFATAAALTALVYAFGGVSGAHFNPAVTFSLAVSRRFPWQEVPLYWLVQCIGGIGGAFVVAGIYSDSGAILDEVGILFGASVVPEGIDQWQAILAEAFIGFLLVTGIMAVAVDPRAPKGWSGLIIGLSLAAGILLTGPASGGSGNFARSLGPFVASLPYDVGKIPWEDLIVYAAGPLIGGSAAALVYESVTGLERVAPAPGPGAATPSGPDVDGDVIYEATEPPQAPPPPPGPPQA